MNGLLKGLGHFSFKFRYAVVAFWFAVVIIGAMFGNKLPDLLTGGGWESKSTDSYEASQVLSGNFNGRTPTSITLLHRTPQLKVGSEEYAAHLK